MPRLGLALLGSLLVLAVSASLTAGFVVVGRCPSTSLGSQSLVPPPVATTPQHGSAARRGRSIGVSMMAGAGGSKPPLSNLKQMKYDYNTIINQAAKAATDAIKTGGMRLITVDYPPNEGPTSIKRFETDRDFAFKLLGAMGFKTLVPIGDEIIIGKNLKIGEYLNQEGLTGFSGKGFGAGIPCPSVNVVLNPSLDVSNLGQLQKMDDGKSPLILINGAVEKLTFFDKLGIGKFVDGFKPAYVLKKVNNGFLFKPSHTAPWETFAIFQSASGPYLTSIDSVAGTRPKYLDVENKVKAAVSANAEALRAEAEEAKQLNKKAPSKTSFW